MGGIGKGHLIREIDALDGIIGRMTDQSAIQFRVLNRRRGAAVQGPRAQCDRDAYKAAMQAELRQTPNLTLIESGVDDIVLAPSSAEVRGVTTSAGQRIEAGKVIITTGTFLRGMIHIGLEKYPAGRHKRDSADVEAPSVGLALTLERLQFPLRRLTTGTPPRLDGRTIDYSQLEVQPSDDPVVPMSFLTRPDAVDRARLLNCHLTFTNERTHDVVRRHKHLLPKFLGNQGKGQGPRYCPALEKKVDRFPDRCARTAALRGAGVGAQHDTPPPRLARPRRSSHQVWLEPEGHHTPTVYPSGINTAFPAEVGAAAVAAAAAAAATAAACTVSACAAAATAAAVGAAACTPNPLHRTAACAGSAGDGAHHQGPGERAHGAAGIRGGVRLCGPALPGAPAAAAPPPSRAH